MWEQPCTGHVAVPKPVLFDVFSGWEESVKSVFWFGKQASGEGNLQHLDAKGTRSGKHNVTIPLCLVKSHSQKAASNVGVLSVYPKIILYYHHQLFFDIKQENKR